MPTQKPLADLIPQIVDHIDRYTDYLQFNQRVYDVLEGQLRAEVEASLQKEIFSARAFYRAKERIPSINVLKKATDKLSKVYSEPPIRLANNKTDLSIVETISREANINSVLNDFNRLYNAQHAAAIEPYLKNGKHHLRVLGAHQCLPFSDDPTDPMTMTVFIKLLGKSYAHVGQEYSPDGSQIQQKQIKEVDLFMLYSDNEVMIIDSQGGIRVDEMEKRGITSMVNPFGKIPVIYKAKTNLQLIPYPNREGFDIAILVPKLLADLNYAAQFLSHSILWTRNANLGDQELNPDVVLDLGDKNDENGNPEIGTIEPKVDISNTISLIEYQLHSYFESIGIKSKSSGMLSNGRDSSALGKAIDESDTSSERKIQIEVFKNVEKQLWSLISTMQDVWSSNETMMESRKFSSSFEENYRVQFPEIRPMKTERQILEEIQLWRDLKMMSRRQAIKELRPDYTDSQIEEWIKDLDKEAEEDFEKMMMGMESSQPERKMDGTFQDGNQAGANQDETSKIDG